MTKLQDEIEKVILDEAKRMCQQKELLEVVGTLGIKSYTFALLKWHLSKQAKRQLTEGEIKEVIKKLFGEKPIQVTVKGDGSKETAEKCEKVINWHLTDNLAHSIKEAMK